MCVHDRRSLEYGNVIHAHNASSCSESQNNKIEKVGENNIFRFCKVFSVVPYGSILVTIKCVGQHGLVWTVSLAPSSSCLRGGRLNDFSRFTKWEREYCGRM